ncbi:Esterase [Nesidiocoris tenuis]|uniref:Carboxylic ester hydrolase n=1 Tax=Nesidiocoris tenuis TaxID=355587 RepID=A0ABN7BFE2_9HEMI|nr:Esterase [Nesidiocoris tenuis]
MGSLDIFTAYNNGITVSNPLVMTNYGLVEGMPDVSRSGNTYYSFKGIPYAKPPTGDLRFADPQPPEKWNGIKKTKANPMFCIQLMAAVVRSLQNIIPPAGKEDCLYLSVATRSLNPHSKLPVAVYIHGGAFVGWGGPSFFRSTFLMDHEMVVVLVNYRLGPMGFLSFEDDVLPGNFGLKDQVLALQWVRDNIQNFGGDPNRVTIMGESAGGASVHAHSFSPMSRGLFHQIMPMSGTAYAFWAFAYPGDARIMAFEYAKRVGCKGDNSTAVLGCLKKRPVSLLVQGTAQYFGLWDLEPTRHLGPVSEARRPGAMTPPSPKHWKPVDLPMMVIEASGEGLLKTLLYKSPLRGRDWKWINKHWDVAIPFSFKFRYNPKHKEIARRMRQYWFGDKKQLDDSDLKNFTAMYTTAGIKSPYLHMVEEAKNTVYYLNFGYLGELSPSLLINDPEFPKLTFHAEYMMYLLHIIFLPKLNGQDLEVSKNLTRMVANFVIHGDPTPKTGEWQPWSKPGYDTLIMDNKGNRMVREGLPAEVAFFRSLCAYKKFYGCAV